MRNRSGYWTAEGADGQKIAYPSHFWTAEGADGAKIAYPSSWWTAEGSDGRKIAYPSSWWTGETSSGRKYAYPSSGCADPCALLESELKLASELKPYARTLLKVIGPSLCE